ncbi:MAG: DUF4342 domain-containing protein [Balneolaceae bacterium]
MTKSDTTILEEVTGTVNEIINQVRILIRKGNARRLVIKNKDDKVLFQSHLTAGVAGTALFTVMAPIVSAITFFILFANDVKILIEKDIDPDSEKEKNKDENEIEAEFVRIHDEEDFEEEGDDEDGDEDDTEKTVGKE